MANERPLYPSEKQDRFIVRLPDGMRDEIRDAAAANKRSMNAEIVHRLIATKDGPYVQIWREEHGFPPLDDVDLESLELLIRSAVLQLHREIKQREVDERRKSLAPADATTEDLLGDLEYINELMLIAKGSIDVTSMRAAEIGRLGARRYRRFPIGGPVIDNPFPPEDPRHRLFIAGWRQEAGDELFKQATRTQRSTKK